MLNQVTKIGLVFLLSLFIVACNQTTAPQAKEIFKTVSSPTLHAGEAIPLPTEDTILTISGKINTHNQGETIIMDMPTIESLGMVEYTVIDPFKKEKIAYQGVLMKDLFELWQVDGKATAISFTALNDYEIDIPITMFDEIPIILAVKNDGEYMPISDRGPAMLVLPTDDYDLDPDIYNKYWAWQLKSIDVQ